MKKILFFIGMFLSVTGIMAQTYSCTEVFSDDFSGDLSNWENMYPNDPNGSWIINTNGQLYGNYNVSCGSVTCPQADLLLKDSLQIADHYRASADFHKVTSYPGHEGAGALFSSWQDTDNKFVIGVGLGGSTPFSSVQDSINVGVQIRQTTWQLGTSWKFYFPWNLDSTNVATLEKHGNIYSIFVNDIFLMDYVDTFLNGNGKLGFHTYGAVLIDNFVLESCSLPTPFNCGDSIADIDGNYYNTVLIGNQCWMEENLNTTHDASGNSITRYCYNNETDSCDIYGGLYTWYTMMNGQSSSSIVPSGVQGICPEGWHIPSDQEWTNLTDYLGGLSVAGGKLKEQGTNYWNSPNTGATNSSGFTGLPGGHKNSGGGTYVNMGGGANWWSTTQGGLGAWYRAIQYNDSVVFRYSNSKTYGFSIRCIKDSIPILSLNASFISGDSQIIVGDSVNFTDISTGNPTTWQWIFEGGTPAISTDQNPIITYNSQGLFDVTLIVGDGQTFDTLWIDDYIHVSPQTNQFDGWYISNTGNNHTILIPQTAAITFDGVPAIPGDYIGVFYDSAGSMACGGYLEYNLSGNLPLTVWGDDSQTTFKEGFSSGEEFAWKGWNSQSGEVVHNANVIYDGSFPNLDVFAGNGMSGIQSVEFITFETQSISMVNGWSIWSTYIDPFEPLMDSIFSEIINEVIIVKNGNGQVFWPLYAINAIGNNMIGEGYQIKMNSAQTFEITGLAVTPELSPISIPQGWSILGYLRQSPANIETMMSPIVSEIIIMKNGAGLVYWPQYTINAIGNMIPGEGYQIKLNSAQSLVYTANTAAFSKSDIIIEQPTYFKTTLNTGSNMTLGIPLSSWETIPNYRDEVAVFTQSGLLVGSGVFTGENMAVTLWGDDEYSNETDGLVAGEGFTLRIWNKENQTESEILIESWLEGDASYETNKIAAAAKLSTQNSELRTFKLYQNTPNPFTGQTEFSFYLPKACKVEFEIFNIIGEKVGTLASDNFESGKHSLIYRSGMLPAGSYYYRLQTPEFSQTRKMTILK
ncbi:MAG: PKD domain-containing protein [Bacteroidales bacterium]|nr:PKD domain-containing protein [Bacteroidales bacterium]MCF8456935.1 PKD domain-containing protein [Bacteroidales bacterium]